ncbi:protein FAM185A isoform X2 [Peromyscus californicus insignis]|uniref:protein FAM185A isoform X2 n=1 Tax=Peromyscus californicus insignis TaxID=564181 RepID=UPI0022A79252|nr:protein FAM185A isoform X2 [Peromyscus californicus insignis]
MFGRLPPCALRVRAGAWFGALGARTRGCDGARRGAADDPRAGLARAALREWTLPVSPFGRLRARLPCHLVVRPLDPLAYPDGDRVQVAVCGAGRAARGLDSLQVQYDAARQEMAILSEDIDPQASVEVNAPVKFDLNIESSGSGSVKVQNIECDSCKIDTAQGTSVLQSVKSQELHVQTKGGNVICLGTICGNIDIHASHHSTVTIDKLQGSCVNISTEDGLLKVKYLYTESSLLSSAAGDIALGNVHVRAEKNPTYSCSKKPFCTTLSENCLFGNIILQSKMGNITVDSSCGCLKASSHQGAIDVYVSQLGEVALTSQEGSITVKAPSSLRAYLQLSGREVIVDEEAHVQEVAKDQKGGGVTVTGLLNQASRHERWINAVAPKGTVKVLWLLFVRPNCKYHCDCTLELLLR